MKDATVVGRATHAKAVRLSIEDTLAVAQAYASRYPSREASLVVTNIEQGLMWLNRKEKP